MQIRNQNRAVERKVAAERGGEQPTTTHNTSSCASWLKRPGGTKRRLSRVCQGKPKKSTASCNRVSASRAGQAITPRSTANLPRDLLSPTTRFHSSHVGELLFQSQDFLEQLVRSTLRHPVFALHGCHEPILLRLRELDGSQLHTLASLRS